MTETTLDAAPSLEIDGKVATITLNRPRVANRLDADDLAVLMDYFEQINGSDVRVLRLRGTGKYFCSGYNIGKLKAERKLSFEDVANALEDCRPITIAQIHGGVYGGATDLVLACDFRVGTPNVSMFMPAARLGLHYYKRGMERYVSRLGIDTAKRLFLTAEKLEAEELCNIGFLTSLVEQDALESEVGKLAETVSSMAPIAVFGMKKHLNQIARNTLDVESLTREIQRSLHSEDLKEGRLAFLEKRKPVFTGR